MDFFNMIMTVLAFQWPLDFTEMCMHINELDCSFWSKVGNVCISDKLWHQNIIVLRLVYKPQCWISIAKPVSMSHEL